MPMVPTFRLPKSGLAVATGEHSVIPNPSTSRPPVIRSNVSATSTGSGAAPERHSFTLPRAYFLTSGWWLIAV